ncbi:OprO/OprP family phosphate-selective porin [Schlesneria paludicola]|uniref:OprO/OprP family phosphate-selective porin n=1 Tax=Schlesneria paludicola TaxID=360056 RepID=UPI000299FD2C|nr:porin [Schlesneria paludicola]
MTRHELGRRSAAVKSTVGTSIRRPQPAIARTSAKCAIRATAPTYLDGLRTSLQLTIVLTSLVFLPSVDGTSLASGQESRLRLRQLFHDDEFVEKDDSLATDFANRLNPKQNEEQDEEPVDEADSMYDESPVLDDVRLANHLNANEKPVSSLVSELTKRLTDVEKQLKKRDESDQQKANQFPTHKITGFLQLDTAFYSQSPKNIATVGDAQDGTGFRRARFAVNGKVAEFTSYQLEVDFATAGRPSFFDNYVEQGNIPILGDVRVGQFLQPFSVDAMSGFRNLAFLERSLPFLAFVPFRRVGIMASNATEDDLTHWAYSVFRTGGYNNAPLGDSRFGTDFGDIGGYSFSTRVTHLLYWDEFADDRYLWHVGFSYDYSQLGANDAAGSGLSGNAGSPKPFYQARTTPEFGPLGYPELTSSFGSAVNGTPLFVDTGRYQANNFNLFGLETVYQYGPFSLQAEYMGTVVQSVVGPVFYHGGYGEFMYRLTGEHRGYDKKLASLKNPVPFADFIPLKADGIRGWGAWGVAARWSFVDLTNPSKLDGHYYDSATNTFTGTSKAGNGVLNDLTLGLTWYLNMHTKVQFNWIHAMLDNSAKGSSTADLFVSRVQVDF